MADRCENEPVHDCDSSCEYDSDASEFRHLACPDFQIRRMTAARILSEAEIDCIVWGRDALEFAHCIAPGTLYYHLRQETTGLLNCWLLGAVAEREKADLDRGIRDRRLLLHAVCRNSGGYVKDFRRTLCENNSLTSHD